MGRGSGTYVTGVQDSSIFPSHLREDVSLITQQSMHVPDKSQILLVSARFAYCPSPFFNGLKDLGLHPRRSHWRALGKSPDEFIEELFCTDL
jgi:hypothetical protein